MTKRMLIDSTHAEETRVVVLDGSRLEDFDVESATKKQLKGNIYLAKVVRVEPSLQAAFVEYGGGRHGFLAFGEIHPDYYQIPVADRQRLLAMQAEEARAEEEDDDAAAEAPAPRRREAAAVVEPEAPPVYGAVEFGAVEFGSDAPPTLEAVAEAEPDAAAPEPDGSFEQEPPPPDAPAPEMLGGESDTFEGNGAEEARQRRTARFLRNYRIQEVIRRRQIMLIQVVKEERGTKGAALTTYISLAGRFCVLMPNSPRGGGISRKITSAADRRRLKEITAELEIPTGMGLIVRTAGAARPKPEIKRDCEYLMRLWDDIRDHTMRSMAPALIYEEASLIKRTIRDVYSRDVDEVVVDGYEGWKAAHDFMRMLMPSHAKKVQLWRTDGPGAQPLFVKHQVEAQLDAMLSPTVQLKSGGYLVINQAEALVAIDVNSGRSTRERGIEETALRTNLEAADEVARQLRLRDLAGLIVIDFIDMDAKKHNAMVERRLKEGLKNDRARIQVGYISHFGLLEMSRQRLRPSLTETNFVTCPHCNGLGHVRSIESSAVHVLRGIEEEGAKDRAAAIMVYAANAIVMYLLNNKRERLAEIEARYAMRVQFAADDTLVPPGIRIDRLRPQVPVEERAVAAPVAPMAPLLGVSDEDVADEDFAAEDLAEGETAEKETPSGERGPRNRRDRGRRGQAAAEKPAAVEAEDAEIVSTAEPGSEQAQADAEENEVRRRRRRRRRGGRREGGEAANGAATDAASDAAPAGDEPARDEAPEEVAELDGPMPPLPLPVPGEEVPMPAELEAPVEPAVAPAVEAAGGEQPSPESELDENGEPRARRRGRRGGRRRRRDAPEDGAAEVSEAPLLDAVDAPLQPAPAPVSSWTGPTPADPFGGQSFDIFDMIDQAAEEDAAFQRARSAAPPPPEPAPEPAPAPAEPVTTGHLGAEVVAVAPAPEPEPEPEPQPEPEPPPPVAAEPEPETPAAQANVIRPLVIGVDEVPAVPAKKGWWRR